MEALLYYTEISFLVQGQCGGLQCFLQHLNNEFGDAVQTLLLKENNQMICSITNRTESMTVGEKLNQHIGNKN